MEDRQGESSRRIEDAEGLAKYGLELPSGCEGAKFGLTPHYARLAARSPAVRRTVLPTPEESEGTAGELADPLGEEAHRVAPHLIHVYPDKVLLLATTYCPTLCRYCTRSRIVRGEREAGPGFEADFRYLKAHEEIRDVLISGGDPLSMSDRALDALLGGVRSVSHVRTLRVGSKVPAAWPSRISPSLCELLRRHRVWLSLHFVHPDELTPETRAACRRLADAGVPMLAQTVLLRDVNDDAETLTELFYGLLEIGVKPYYLLQCDPVVGSARFRTPVAKGIELIRSLHGRIAGPAVPQFVLDAPGGGGKVPLLDERQLRREGGDVIVTNHEGKAYRYPDGAGASGANCSSGGACLEDGNRR